MTRSHGNKIEPSYNGMFKATLRKNAEIHMKNICNGQTKRCHWYSQFDEYL